MTLRKGKNFTLRSVHQLIGRYSLIQGKVHQPRSRCHQQSFYRRVFNNLAVMLNVGGGWDFIDQLGQKRRAADFF